MWEYTDEVKDHFLNPRNVGEIPDADGIGEEGNPVCGDMMTFYIKVAAGRLADIKFRQNDFAASSQKVAELLGKDYVVKVDGPWAPFSFIRRIELFQVLNGEDEANEGKGERAA